MKKHRGFLWVLALLPLLASLDSPMYAQSAKNPERDLGTSFARERGRTEFDALYGEVVNRSPNNYPCVRVEFNVESSSGPNTPRRHLGVVSVEVRNVQPHSERKYYQPLPYMAPVISRKSISECSGGSGENVVTPPTPGFCSISVQINNDRRTYQTTVWLLRADGSPTLKVPRRIGLGRFSYINVPEGRYKVIVKGRYPAGEGRSGGLAPFPGSQSVVCRPNGAHRAVFKIESTEG